MIDTVLKFYILTVLMAYLFTASNDFLKDWSLAILWPVLFVKYAIKIVKDE